VASFLQKSKKRKLAKVQTTSKPSINLSFYKAKGIITKTKKTMDDMLEKDELGRPEFSTQEQIMLSQIIDEAAGFLHNLQKIVITEQHVGKQLKEYMELRTQYYFVIIRNNKFNTQLLHHLLPKFLELYEEVMQQEVAFVAGLIQEGINTGQILQVNSRQLAYSIISLCDAVKHHAEQVALAQGSDDANYTEALENYTFMLKLVFKGLLPKPIAA
jgi:hypothetical protein